MDITKLFPDLSFLREVIAKNPISHADETDEEGNVQPNHLTFQRDHGLLEISCFHKTGTSAIAQPYDKDADEWAGKRVVIEELVTKNARAGTHLTTHLFFGTAFYLSAVLQHDNTREVMCLGDRREKSLVLSHAFEVTRPVKHHELIRSLKMVELAEEKLRNYDQSSRRLPKQFIYRSCEDAIRQLQEAEIVGELSPSRMFAKKNIDRMRMKLAAAFPFSPSIRQAILTGEIIEPNEVVGSVEILVHPRDRLYEAKSKLGTLGDKVLASRLQDWLDRASFNFDPSSSTSRKKKMTTAQKRLLRYQYEAVDRARIEFDRAFQPYWNDILSLIARISASGLKNGDLIS